MKKLLAVLLATAMLFALCACGDKGSDATKTKPSDSVPADTSSGPKAPAEAEAEATRIIAESLTQEILDKIMADKWDGKLPSVVAGADANMGMMLPDMTE